MIIKGRVARCRDERHGIEQGLHANLETGNKGWEKAGQRGV
jgi:hypothetical protein